MKQVTFDSHVAEVHRTVQHCMLAGQRVLLLQADVILGEDRQGAGLLSAKELVHRLEAWVEAPNGKR